VVVEVDLGKVGGCRAHQREVAGVHGAAEVGVRRALDRHEHWFADPEPWLWMRYRNREVPEPAERFRLALAGLEQDGFYNAGGSSPDVSP
jgi:hypothetical protein